MSTFKQRTARRIAIVSTTLALLTAPLAGMMVSEHAEEDTVALAMEESKRMLLHFSADKALSSGTAKQAADALVGGLFDIAEIYDADGAKLAEALTRDGEAFEAQLPRHGRPNYAGARYESLTVDGARWVLRVFIPLHASSEAQAGNRLSGYFEGVRIVPDWQRAQIRRESLIIALIVGFASLLCGAVIYPVVVHLSRDNERKAREVLESHISMMEALGRAIARRDSDTGAHNYRVAWIAAQIAHRLGERGSAMQALIIGSFLHDVGKIGIPDAILLKPGRLDDEEMKIMRTHVALGTEIVSGIGWLEHANEVVLGHHERWDGTGYPNGHRTREIPLGARIFAVADVFDALTSKRPYKEAFTFSTAIGIIEKDAGAHFDPAVVDAFLEIAPRIHECLSSRDENGYRDLLAEEIRLHFGL